MNNHHLPRNDTTRRPQVSPRRRDSRSNGRNAHHRKRSTSRSRALRERHSTDDAKQGREMDRSPPENPPKARLSQYAVNRLREIVKSIREDRGVASEESVVISDDQPTSPSAESPPPRHNNRLHKEWTDVNGYKGRYVGEVNDDGQPHGWGTMRYNYGLVHEGEWVNGVRKEETSLARIFNNTVGWNPTGQSAGGVMPLMNSTNSLMTRMNSTNSLMTRSSGSLRGDSSMVSNPHHMTMHMHPMMMNTSRIQHLQQRPMQMHPMMMHAPRMMMDQSITPHGMMIQSQQQQQQQQQLTTPMMMQGYGYPPPQAASSMVPQQALAPYHNHHHHHQQQGEELNNQGDFPEVELPMKPPSPAPSPSPSQSQKEIMKQLKTYPPPPPYRN